MKFDKLKPNLQELNLNGVKKAASRVAHVRIRLSRGQWIGVIAGLVVVTVLLVILLRPRPAAVVLPVVAVEPVTTEDVNIYGDYVGRIRAQQFVEIAPASRATSKRCSSPKVPTSGRDKPSS